MVRDSRDDVPEYVAEHLREAMAVDPAVHELGIRVQLTPGQVRVSGSAATVEQREAITELVQRMVPELTVLNEVEVVPAGAAHDEEDLG